MLPRKAGGLKPAATLPRIAVPKISIVIPTLDRAAVLTGTIDRIESQTVARESYEVIVVDNSSADDTLRVLEAKARSHANLKFFIQRKRGAAATRNVGLRESSGDIVLFIDDDILAEPDLIEKHLRLRHHRIAQGIRIFREL